MNHDVLLFFTLFKLNLYYLFILTFFKQMYIKFSNTFKHWEGKVIISVLENIKINILSISAAVLIGQLYMVLLKID